jgi:hypothetical protein
MGIWERNSKICEECKEEKLELIDGHLCMGCSLNESSDNKD